MKKSMVLLCLALAGLALFSGSILKSFHGVPTAPATAAATDNTSPSRGPGTDHSIGAAVAQTNPASSLPKARAQRAWDPLFFDRVHDKSPGQPIRFELVGAEAQGVIKHMERANGQVIYVSGDLTSPEGGRFFFQKQTKPGKAGDYVGVVEFPGSKVGYRVEPADAGLGSVLVRLPLDQVVCMAMPAPDPVRNPNPEIRKKSEVLNPGLNRRACDEANGPLGMKV